MPELPPAAGKKRAAEDKPTLLPAFELVSSSPQLPRPTKRMRVSNSDNLSPSKQLPSKGVNEQSQYPTPVPTSSTGLMSSSPPQVRTNRPLQRTTSTQSSRTPLASVPTITLDVTGEPTLLGRSGRSSHYQINSSKYISRVHITAIYVTRAEHRNPRVEIVCLGWNGVRVHCQGQAWDLEKNDTFTSESKDSDIMVDVQGARVLLRWPVSGRRAITPDESDFSDNSPPRVNTAPLSPSSSPSRAVLQASLSPQINSAVPTSIDIQIYEDDEDDKENSLPDQPIQPTQSTIIMSQPFRSLQDAEEEFSDRDEENDPLVHAMGPFGHNLLPQMAAFSTGNVKEDAIAKTPERSLRLESSAEDQVNPVLNHVLNQLAYSRLSSTPLSMLLHNLPLDLNGDEKKIKAHDLQVLVDRTACVGEVRRAGKDAAGKQLESEYYYIPECDFDPSRRDAVVDGLRKPGLRTCRKQHKVCR